ncbi:signal peptidase II [Chitinimonas koreensis]|uniref:signal peptidase II n=1 Tax=Chitinimonas koreensis TaxID=356302 RepID=UPI00040F4AAC|nr:signal peptidase II [Chitinimonas koreensis]
MLKAGLARWLVLAAVVIVLDQASKLAVEAALNYGDVIPLFPGFNLVLTYNPGAAFSFLASAGGWQRHFFTVLGLVVAVVLVHLLRRHHAETRFAAALALILGGALGNVIDRVLYGHVIDFLDAYWGVSHWPAFNIADSAICLGAALMVIDSFASGKPKRT